MPQREEAEHNSQDVYYRSPVGAVEAGKTIQLGIQLHMKEAVEKVLLRLWREGDGERLIEMTTKASENEENRLYTVKLPMPERGCLVWYYFIVAASSGTFYYGNNMEHLGGFGDVYENVPPSFQITVYNKGAKTPDWFKHTVMYQIFPDRFYRQGNQLIEKKGAVIHASWEDKPCYYKDVDTKEIVAYDFFGGNLRGIEEKLSYLKELGISVIYLNPVFESPSNHHYDTGDYHKIDPILGTNEDFHELCAKAREMGIHIFIDGVFSHTGSDSRYFNREGSYDTVGAFQSVESPYYEWYNFHKYPYEYDSWWGFSTLPNVSETTPSYMDFIIHDENSVLHHWMKQGISGWRLDVVDELPAKFTQSFYQELKHTDPEAVLIGEVWEDASNKISYGVPREYLCGQEIDSAMNYPFRKIVLDFLLGNVDAGQSMRRLESLRENYPKENFYVMMNLLGSHDVERLVTLLGEAPFYDGMPAVQQSRFRLDTVHFNLAIARLRMAVLWQMTYPGVPCVYYGDEIAMQGFKDPYNRAPYEWEHGDDYTQNWYKKVIALRNEHMALQTGEFLPLYSDGEVMAYARLIRGGQDVFGKEAKNEVFLVVLNRSRVNEAKISLDISDFGDGEFKEAFRPENKITAVRGRLEVKIAPLMGTIYEQEMTVQKYPREAGILLHPTSLPSKYGIGDFGREAYRFIDFLAEAGQKIWQILPLGPVGYGYSPYQSPSAFAGNPMLISLDRLLEDGLLRAQDVKVSYARNSSFVDFEHVWSFKKKCLRKAFLAFMETAAENADYQEFCEQEGYWLEDYALFCALKREYKDKAWMEWPEALRKREKKNLADSRRRLEESIGFEKFLQYIFQVQWSALHEYAKSKGIRIMGDMPIFISQDSADVWMNQKLFRLNEEGYPKTVAGVPPDYFSATGQLWGNPQYDWEAMKEENYSWWKKRFRKLYALVDIVRIDHFRGFESYWEVDGKAKTAINGRWVKGPGREFFAAMEQELGNLPIVAEDLGIITDAVEKLRDDCGYPGMKVLHFTLHFNEMKRMGFVAPENSIVYTGTHDNNTTVGWYTENLDASSAAAIAELLHADPANAKEICRKLVEFAYASAARMAIVPMQDILELDSRSRMNLPGTVGLNWKWCLRENSFHKEDAARLKDLCEKYQR